MKSAQRNLCVNLARQYAPYNVMLNRLSPGLVETERNIAGIDLMVTEAAHLPQS